MKRFAQILLLLVGIGMVVSLVWEIVLAIAATQPRATPARVENMAAGPYMLIVRIYDDPAQAGYALPFQIDTAPGSPVPQSYEIVSVPDTGIHATPVRASFSMDSAMPGEAKGDAEITVRGQWYLYIVAQGTAGDGSTIVRVTAIAPPPIPISLGWLIGLVPLFALFGFLIMQQRVWRRHQREAVPKPLGTLS